jgi:hypothetical protein
MAVSCTDDYTNPKVISGTSWKSTDTAGWKDAEFIFFKFTSETVVEQWVKCRRLLKNLLQKLLINFRGKQ